MAKQGRVIWESRDSAVFGGGACVLLSKVSPSEAADLQHVSND